jgi:Na+/proline symporter
MAGDFLPRILPGLLGIFIAALLASVMSSCDSFMIASSALFTENIYKQVFRDRAESHYIWVGRYAALVIVLGGMILAFQLPSVVAGLELFWKVYPMMGIAFWMGFFWRKMTAKGAWASTIGAISVWWLTTQSFFISILSRFTWAESLQMIAVDETTVSVSLPWQMILYLSAGVFSGIIVSLVSQPVDQNRLDRYYRLVKTPVVPDEPSPAIQCTIGEGVDTPQRKEFFPGSSIHLPILSRTSVFGFLGVGVFVLLLIGSVLFIVST